MKCGLLCPSPRFPKELSGEGKRKSSVVPTPGGKRVRFNETVALAGPDLDNVPSQALLEVADTAKGNLD